MIDTLEKKVGVNAKLGLPFQDKMQKFIIAFDVDGTLIDEKDNPYEDILTVLRVVSKWKNIKIMVWSGGGKDYAATIGHRLGLDDYVWRYASKLEHTQLKAQGYNIIAVDDIQDTAIGNVANLIVRNK